METIEQRNVLKKRKLKLKSDQKLRGTKSPVQKRVGSGGNKKSSAFTYSSDIREKFPILTNTNLIVKFMSVPMTNNQKGRIRQILREHLKGTSDVLLPETIYNRIKTLLQGSLNPSDSDLRKIRILYNMLKTALENQKKEEEKLTKKNKVLNDQASHNKPKNNGKSKEIMMKDLTAAVGEGHKIGTKTKHGLAAQKTSILKIDSSINNNKLLAHVDGPITYNTASLNDVNENSEDTDTVAKGPYHDNPEIVALLNQICAKKTGPTIETPVQEEKPIISNEVKVPKNSKKILNAVKTLTNSPFKDNKVKLKRRSVSPPGIKKKKIRNKRYVVFVGNLPPLITKQQIRSHFWEMSDHIKDVRIPEQQPGLKKWYAYLELSNEPSYEFALSKNHSMLGNKRINVKYTLIDKNKLTEAQVKAKTLKLQALQKAGKLIGSIALSKKRSQRRKKMREARAKEQAKK